MGYTDEEILNKKEKARESNKEDDEEEYEEKTMIVKTKVVIVKKRIVIKPLPAPHCAGPEIYLNSKRVVLLLVKVTSVQFTRGVCTVFLVLMKMWKLWLV